MASYKQSIFDYVREKYGTEPDYPWRDGKNDSAAVLRHRGNLKWYGLVMDIPKSRLGLKSGETVDVLNIKCEKLMIGSLLMNDGYFPAYHMNKENWITVILDGTVPFEEICGVLDISYGMTVNKKRGRERV